MVDRSLSRLRFFWNCINPYFKTLFTVYTVLGALTWIRDELFPAYKDSHVFNYLPDWPWYLWISVLALILAIALVEGWYQQAHLQVGKDKSVFDASGEIFKTIPRRSKFAAIGIPIILLILMVGLYVAPAKWLTKNGPVSAQQVGPSIGAPSKAQKQEPLPPIALTLRFDPMVSFPFRVQPHTTTYAILARLKEEIPWGAYEIRNDDNDLLIWPDVKSLQWNGPKIHRKSSKEFPGLPDMAIALDITNHSSSELINVKLEVGFDFYAAIQEGPAAHSGAKIATRKHTVVIPVIKPNAPVRLYVGNQSAKHFVTVSFPKEATALLPAEVRRRTIKLIKTGVNILEALPLFSLSPARVRWIPK